MAGWPVPGVTVRVVDYEMHDVPRDMQSIGEVVAMGDHVMEGYYKEPEATAAVMTGPWFHTGDMAVWDEEGYLHIVDRKKEIIISGGENISSIEVERAIFSHPAVFECAVVAAPQRSVGRGPRGDRGAETRRNAHPGRTDGVPASSAWANSNCRASSNSRTNRCPKPAPAKFAK